MAIFGPDIASYQGTPNMRAVAGGGNDYTIIKVSESTNYINPTWQSSRANAHAAGMIVGLYHFSRNGNPQAEARYFVNAISSLQDNEFPVLDWEVPGDAANWSKAWLDEVARLTGVKAFVYLNQYYVNNFDWSAVVAAGYPLWLALYDGDPWTFQPMKFWGAPPLKQYTDAAQIPGIAGNVDRNSFNGDRAALLAYCKGGSPAPPLPQGDDMKLARTADTGGTIWLCTDLDVAATQDPALYASLKKVWGDEVAVTSDDITRMQADAAWRLGQVVDAVIAKLPAQHAAVAVDATAVAAALAANDDLKNAIAKAAADEVSKRLQS